MKKTLQDQYLLIKEGKGHKDIFIKEAKRQFPGLIRNAATYTEVANVLKTKNLINENVIGLEPINQLPPSKKESFEVAFENFLAEAKKEYFDDEKAELKKTSKQVEEDAEKNFDYEDKKNPDNLIFDQIMKGYYTEMKDPKNENKTMEQLKSIVIKNLEKNPTYYTEKGQFGVKDLGYTVDHPGLGEPKEPKGKYKSSGYGNLNEGIESHSFKVGDKVRFDGSIATIVNIGGGYAQLDWNDEFIEVSVKRLKPIQESINEEDQIRKVVRSIINEELEEGYADREMGAYQLPEPRHTKNPQDMGTYLNAIKGMKKVEAIEYLGEEGLSSSMVMRVLNKADQMGMFDVQDMFDVNPTIRGDVFEDKEDDGFDEVWEKFKKDLRKRMGQPESPKNESLNESKIRKVIRESVEKELAEINKLAEYEVFESKLEKIAELIERKSARLNRLDEDEDLKALTDKKKVKELQKDIKKLEKAKAKIEKALAKKAKSTPKKKEVIDEDEPISEIASEDAEATSTAAGEAADELERAADAAKELDDALEEGVESTDYRQKSLERVADEAEEMFERLTGRDNAGGNMSDEDALANVLSEFPAYMGEEIEFVEQHLMGKYKI
tara:strand:- start:702 stop:2528 length:1827 start_codon:yes stop_codon:yes gene_type:complete